MPVINPATNKLIVKTGGTAGSLDTLGSAWLADLFAFCLSNPAFNIFDIVVSNVAPATDKLWFDPAGSTTQNSEEAQGQLKVYASGAWTNCTPSHFANFISYRVTQPIAGYTEATSAPTASRVGHIWRNTNTITVSGVPGGGFSIWNGSSWTQMFTKYYAPVNSNLTATVGSNYLVNTTNGPVTITLPTNPAADSQIFFADAANFKENNLIIVPGGSNTIHGYGSSDPLSVNRKLASFGLMFKGTDWRIF